MHHLNSSAIFTSNAHCTLLLFTRYSRLLTSTRLPAQYSYANYSTKNSVRQPSFNHLFDASSRSTNQHKLQDLKVSNRPSQNALFKECVDEIRKIRYEADPGVDNKGSLAIEQLTKDELDIVTKIFKRVDPDRKIIPRIESQGHHIDPYWDPFEKVEKLKAKVAYEFNEYARLVNAAEARRQRAAIRKSFNASQKIFNPINDDGNNEDASKFPRPHRLHEQYWDPSPDMRLVLKNNNRPITWRDTHVMHNFVAENGLILPRRVTYATRYQQKHIFKAICMARSMGVFPLDWKPSDTEKMPIMDPIQYIADELVQRYIARGDLRAEAMVQAISQKYPDVNIKRYLIYKAKKAKQDAKEQQQAAEEESGDFSSLLRRYKQAANFKKSTFAPP